MATTSNRQVQLGPPDRGKDAASRAASGRLCEEPGCPTILSTYNAASTCWLHSTATYRHPLARQ